MVEVASFFHRVLDDLLRAWRLRQLSDGDHFRSTLNQFLNFETDFSQIDIEVFENVRGNSAAFFNQPQENVLGPDVFVVEIVVLLGLLTALPCVHDL